MANFADVQSLSFGPFRVTLLPDGGGIVDPAATYPASSTAAWHERYPHLLNPDGMLMVTIGGFLIETGDHKILMDLGLGPMTIDFPGFGPFIGGKYLENFLKTGLKRTDVTDVVYTHLHLDHVGWTTVEEDGRRVLTFPNARHLVTEKDWAFWYGGDHPAGPHPEFVQKPLAGVIQFMSPGDTLAPGITVLDTPGHTPGHVSLELNAGAERMIIIVDLLHSVAQFNEVDWGVAFDIDPEQARATRARMLPELLKPDTITADAHFADRVFGRLHHDGQRYIWQPL